MGFAPGKLRFTLCRVCLCIQRTSDWRWIQTDGMDTAKAEAYGQAWGRLLDRSVKGMADDYGVVLLVGPSVLAGAPDLTAELEERLEHEIAVFK